MNAPPVQIVLVVVAGLIFLAGVLARHYFHKDPRVSKAEIAAAFLAGFIIFGIPLCPALYFALLATNSQFITVLPSIVPIFVAGFIAQTELKNMIDRHETKKE